MNPEIATTAVIHPLTSILEPLAMETLFPRRHPLEIELGSGDGSFLTQYAASCPQRNFLGIERLLGRLRKMERKAAQLGLDNLRVLRIEAAYFLEFLLPAASAEAIHVYFPDPWPKRKHRRHRLINKQFTDLARRSLACGGTVYLRTDDPDYFAQMKRVFAASPFFGEIPTPEALAAIGTDFERNFYKQGVPTLRAAYQLLKRQ